MYVLCCEYFCPDLVLLLHNICMYYACLYIAEEVSGIPDEDQMTRIYAAIRNLPHPIPNLAFYQALSCLRLASILQVPTCYEQ